MAGLYKVPYLYRYHIIIITTLLLRAVERARLLVHLGDEGVELADLLLHVQPCGVRSEEVRVLILQLLPHCAVLRPVTTVRGQPGQRAGRRT